MYPVSNAESQGGLPRGMVRRDVHLQRIARVSQILGNEDGAFLADEKSGRVPLLSVRSHRDK
jgi:hypothetical protein